MSEPVALFLTINGVQVEGESEQTSLGRAQSIECVYYHQAIDTPSQISSGKGTARRQYGPLLIRKRVDKASPLIARALIQNSVVDAVFKFFRTRQDGTLEQFYTTQIRQARIASFSQYVPDVLEPATASEPPLEEVTFVFQSIEWTHSNTGVTYQDSWLHGSGRASTAATPATTATGTAIMGVAPAVATGGAPAGATGAARPGVAAAALAGASRVGAAPAGAAVGASGRTATSAVTGGDAAAGTSALSADQVVPAVVAGPPSRVARILPLTDDDKGPETTLGRTEQGKNGQPSPNTFTSPNGQFSVTVADSGLTIAGPDNSITLHPDGSIKVAAAGALDLRAGASAKLDAGESLDLRAGGSAELEARESFDLRAGGTGTLQAAGAFNLNAAGLLNLRAGASALLDAGTSLDLRAGGTGTLQAAGAFNLNAAGLLNLRAGASALLHAGTSLDLRAGGTGTLQAAGVLNLKGSTIHEN